MTETPLPNSAEARTSTGEIKEPATITPETTTTETPAPASEPAKADGDTVLGGEKKPDAKATVPDKYEFKAPDSWAEKGYELDPAILDQATPIFKDLGLSQEAAQKLVSFYAEQSQKDHEALMTRVREENEAMVAEVKADPEIGSKLDQVQATVNKALDGLGDPKLAAGFREAMTKTGAGNNLHIIRAVYKFALASTEGGSVIGNGPAAAGQRAPGTPARPTAARALYPNNP